ncbi:Electron transport complex protein RnfE [uncultured Candidatus Thioglobus sp.]|nr:Electron transport complex protein RnfE [uncultured Candidatus Thioglobus sp.]
MLQGRQMQLAFLSKENLTLVACGLCPLSLVVTSTMHAIAMGSIFFAVFLCSSIVLSITRSFIPQIIRLPMLLISIACIVTVADILIQAFQYEWHIALGIYIPLLCMNSIIVANAEENIVRNRMKEALRITIINGLSVVGILLLVGIIKDSILLVIADSSNFITFNAAPNTFLVLACIFASIQHINGRRSAS